MKNAKKKIGFSKVIAVVLAILSIVMPTIGVYADEFIEPRGQAAGIQNGASYMIKNAVSDKYLTLPGYFDVEYDGKNNVYQSSAKVNDQYSRAVTVSYSNAAEKYNLSPLLFQGIITGGLKNDGSGNVVYGKTTSAEYNWAIEKVNATQYRIYCGGLALTSYGVLTGNVNTTGVEVSGNIYLTTIDQDSKFQLWTFEAVTVNPHMLKNSNITKKNLGTGAEWLFHLGSGEMGSNSSVKINSVDFSNTSIVRSEIIGEKRVIVKFNGDASPNNDRSDDYTVMTFNLKKDQETFVRIAVIQDAGTGANDACLTLPFEAEKKLRVVTLEEEANSEYILTFKSMPNIKITNWQILSDTGVEFAKSSGIELKGENFAVVKFNAVGFAVVRATDISGAVYTLMLDVNVEYDDGIHCAWNSFTIENSSKIEVGRNQYVMIRLSNPLYELLDHEITMGSSVEVIDYNEDCMVLKTKDTFFKTLFILTIGDKLDDGEEIIANSIELSFEEDVSDRIDGIRYIRNIKAEKYLQIDNTDPNPNASGVKTEIHPLDPEDESQLWDFVYLHNGYYCILSKKSNMALGVKANEVTKADSSVCQFTCKSTLAAGTNLQWKIEPVRVLNGIQQYKITNRATLEAGYNYVMCANGTLNGSDGVIDLYIGNNDSYLDEWSILTIREIFGVHSIGISDIYEIQYNNSRIYSGVNDTGGHLGDITCETYDNITFAGGLWRFEKVSGGAYRIFSMENCVLGEEQYALGILDGDVVLLMDDDLYYQNTLWYIGESPDNDDAICIYSVVDNSKFLSVVDGNVIAVTYDTDYSQFYLEKYEFPNLWDGWYNGLVKTEKNGKMIYQIRYIIADTATGAYRTNIEEAIALWHFDLIGIEFIETTNPNDALITFEYNTDNGLNFEAALVIENLILDDESVMNENWDDSKIVFTEKFSDVEDKTLAIAHEIGHALKLGHEMMSVVETVMWSTESTEGHEGNAYSELSVPTYYDLFAVKQKLESVEA